MAIKAANKYKNLLSKANREMMTTYKITSLCLGQYCSQGDNVEVWTVFNNRLFNVRMHLMVKCPWKFKVVESSGVLYVGLDLGGCKIVEDDHTKWRRMTFKAAFAEQYFDKFYGDYESDISNRIFNELQDRANNPKYVIDTKPSIRANLEVLDCSPTFRKIDKEFQQFLDSNFSVELRDGMHPGLSDRSLYPFIWIDLEESRVTYLDGHYGRNSRQNRKVCSLEFFINNMGEVCRYAIMNSPIQNLIQLKGSSSYVQHIEISTK